MAEITFDRFDLGLDLRKGASVSDANRLRVLTNAFVNTGHTISKRPAARKIATLEAGTKGLRPGFGFLQTFYGSGSIVHANPLFRANLIPSVNNSAVSRMHFGAPFLGAMYVVAEYVDGTVAHHYLDGTNPPRIVDPNCPQTKAVTIAAQRIWASGVLGNTVSFCAAGLPRNWTGTDDAGFLSTGIQQEASQICTALGNYWDKLVVFFADGAQLWTVDPDPANNTLTHRIGGVGCPFPRGPAQFSTDIFFPSAIGVRSITTAANSDNMQDVDVGSPVDSILAPTLVPNALGAFVPGLGQYWLAVGNGIVWVFSFSKTSKVSAWSEYIFPFVIDDFASLTNSLYMRSGDDVYLIDPTQFTDEGVSVPVSIEMPFLDFKLGGHDKQIYAVDAVVQGTCTLAMRFDPRDPSKITDTITLSSDTRPGVMIPVELTASEIAPVISHSANEFFRLDWLKFYFNDLGPK
jgi:hypothetical protein